MHTSAILAPTRSRRKHFTSSLAILHLQKLHPKQAYSRKHNMMMQCMATMSA
jgi:hypothetical protein